MKQTEPQAPFPNVKARLRVSAKSPVTPPREHFLTIWASGARFRVCDESGRHVSAILADVEAPRGLGAVPQSIEDIMDRWTPRDALPAGRTDLFGDLGTANALVVRGSQEPWPMEAERLAPVARQILADDPAFRGSTRRSPCVRLGRPATEIRGSVEGTDQGVAYRNEVTRVISPPYLLFSDVRNADAPDHYFVREIMSLVEGAVSDADLAAPRQSP